MATGNEFGGPRISSGLLLFGWKLWEVSAQTSSVPGGFWRAPGRGLLGIPTSGFNWRRIAFSYRVRFFLSPMATGGVGVFRLKTGAIPSGACSALVYNLRQRHPSGRKPMIDYDLVPLGLGCIPRPQFRVSCPSLVVLKERV